MIRAETHTRSMQAKASTPQGGGVKIVNFQNARIGARLRVSGCGTPLPSRRPCSDLAKLNLEVRLSAPKKRCMCATRRIASASRGVMPFHVPN